MIHNCSMVKWEQSKTFKILLFQPKMVLNLLKYIKKRRKKLNVEEIFFQVAPDRAVQKNLVLKKILWMSKIAQKTFLHNFNVFL